MSVDTSSREVIERSIHFYEGLQKYIQKKPYLAPLKKMLPATMEQMHDYNFVRQLHFLGLQKSFMNSGLKELMIQAIDEYTRTELGIPPAPKLNDPIVKKQIQQLENFGHTSVAPITDTHKLQEIRHFFETEKVERNSDKARVTLEEARQVQNLGGFPVDTILRCPHLMEIATDPEVISTVQGYLGALPTIVVLAAWWSLAGKPAPKDAQLFHYDLDDYHFVKLFIYLTDVDENSGPHCYVEGTHRLGDVMAVRSKWSEETYAFDQFYFRSLRKSDEDVKKYFGKEPLLLSGKSGTRFLVDTRGIHKGVLPKTRDRLLAQVTYGVSPALQDAPTLLRADSEEFKYIPDYALEAPFSYVHRLFVDKKPN